MDFWRSSTAGGLISSHRAASQRPICTGARMIPLGILQYPDYCSNALRINLGAVVLKKLRALNRVRPFPNPGDRKARGACV